MMNVLELNVDVKIEGRGATVMFSGEIGSKVTELLTNEEMLSVREKVKEISDIVNDAIKRDIDETLKEEIENVNIDEFREFLEQERDRIKSKMSEEELRKIEDFEKKLDACKTKEERTEVAIKALLESLDNMMEGK